MTLRPAALAVFLLACAGAAASIVARWPHQFMGPGDIDRVPHEFLYMGTLLAPPLPLLLLFGASAFLVAREDRLGFIAVAGMIPMLGAMTVGSLGEALSAASPDAPRSIQVIGGVAGAAVYCALLAVATRTAFERRKSATGGRDRRADTWRGP